MLATKYHPSGFAALRSSRRRQRPGRLLRRASRHFLPRTRGWSSAAALNERGSRALSRGRSKTGAGCTIEEDRHSLREAVPIGSTVGSDGPSSQAPPTTLPKKNKGGRRERPCYTLVPCTDKRITGFVSSQIVSASTGFPPNGQDQSAPEPRKATVGAHSNPVNRNGGSCPADRTVFPTRLGKVVAIKIHHLVPRCHEVFHKHLLRVVTCIDFRDRPELGV